MRPPAAFVRYARQTVAARFEHRARCPVYGDDGFKRFGIGSEAQRHREEILEFEIASRVQPAREDVHHRDRQHGAPLAGQIAPQRQPAGACDDSCHRAGDAQNSVRP